MDLDLILAIIIGLIFGSLMYTRFIEKKLDEVEEEVSAMMNKLIFLQIETHTNGVFAYNFITNEFVCQGKDLEDLKLSFGKRFPKSTGVIVEPDKKNVQL